MKENYNSLGEAPRVLSSGSGSVRNFKNEVSVQQNAKKLNGFLYLFLLFTSVFSSAQVTTNSGSGLAPTYTSLANAVTALNSATITSPVVITLIGNETAPAGGYRITAQGDVTNTIIIQGVTSTITASNALTVGALNDAIFKLVGADFVTIRNFTMQENAANTVATPATSNNMTEWGVALLYGTAIKGSQNNTIQGNTISLNKTYRNSFGIYSNSTHTETDVITSATATGAAGSNTGLSILSNTISNVNLGIAVVGPTAAADHNQSLTIGGAGLGNTITDYSTNVQLSSFANASFSVGYGISVRNTANFTISYNTITSSNGGYIGTASTFRGIDVPSFSNAPIGTLTQTIDYNIISLRPGVANAIITGIAVEPTTGNDTTSLSISNNDFNNTGHTVAGTGSILFISNGMANLITNINSNTFTNLTVNTTGGIQFISNSYVRPANAITNVNNNAIVGAFAKTASAATPNTVVFYRASGATTATSATEINTGNNFSNVTVVGITTIAGWQSGDGSSTAPFGSSKTVTNNTFNNITGGTGTITVLQVYGSNAGTTNMVANNTISNVSGGGAITGIGCPFWTSQRIENNTVSGLTSVGANAVSGITVGSSAGGAISIVKNRIYNLEATNVGGSVNGILANSVPSLDIQNNMIGDLRTPNADAANPLKGISINGTTGTYNVSNNTILLNGSSTGTNFGSSALSVGNTAVIVALRNNILVNNSTANGSGLATALRYSTTDLSNYAATSNNNLFFASTIFTDGTNTDATLAAYKARVAPRDAAAVTENPPFLSTVGANANFLHIDTTVPTWAESRGMVIAGITDDFDGNVRHVSTPDIGADEFNGLCMTTSNSATQSACDGYTWSVNGTNYTTSGTYNHVLGCHTETLNLTITTTPAAPTGSSTQTLNGGVASDVTIEDIVVSGTGIVWYPTALDATNGTNPIAPGTVLTDNTTYYAVSVNGTCSSSALAVTVTVVLGNVSFDLSQLSYHPNPVKDIFNMKFNQKITSIQIFDLTGRMVQTIRPNSEIAQIDFSQLSPAMYIMKLQSEDGKQTEIKIIKE